MKVLIYDNKEKDSRGVCLKKLVEQLYVEDIKYEVTEDEDLLREQSADAIFALGGDGTILFLTEFAARSGIPIIGVNAGKLGFLTEFEVSELKDAVYLLKNRELKEDKRAVMKISYGDKTFFALNDVFLQRVYSESASSMIADITIAVNKTRVNRFQGDGVIVCTPTGSTAYSLSAGGPIMATDAKVFAATAIAAHSFSQRPIVFSSDSECAVSVQGAISAGLYVDGKPVGVMKNNDTVYITQAENPVYFLRRREFNFFHKINDKLKRNYGGNDYD